MSETITLPRSGLPLQPFGHRKWLDALGHIELGHIGERWFCKFLGHSLSGATRDAAIEFLDARVIHVRAALLPADARERVARALQDRGIICGGNEEEDRQALIAADAVLAALGGQP